MRIELSGFCRPKRQDRADCGSADCGISFFFCYFSDGFWASRRRIRVRLENDAVSAGSSPNRSRVGRFRPENAFRRPPGTSRRRDSPPARKMTPFRPGAVQIGAVWAAFDPENALPAASRDLPSPDSPPAREMTLFRPGAAQTELSGPLSGRKRLPAASRDLPSPDSNPARKMMPFRQGVAPIRALWAAFGPKDASTAPQNR